jgi:hypothetical protein
MEMEKKSNQDGTAGRNARDIAGLKTRILGVSWSGVLESHSSARGYFAECIAMPSCCVEDQVQANIDVGYCLGLGSPPSWQTLARGWSCSRLSDRERESIGFVHIT